MQIIQEIGNRLLMEREKTLFLCSKKAPISLYDNIFNWVDSLTTRDCVICFNTSELEVEVMKALLVNRIPTILVVMNKFTDRYNFQIQRALEEDRIMIITLQRDEPRGKGQTPRLRNAFVLQMAAHVVCGYINKNGSIFPLLAGLKDVRYLDEEQFLGAAEDIAPSHLRWKVWEDKTLLRMYYEDMGIHAIKKRLNRTYLSVRNRTHSLTMSEDVLKGREFEDFVLELFDLSSNSAYSLIEWRSDKTKDEVFPVGNGYPDFVIEFNEGKNSKKFSIEYKWRATISKLKSSLLFTPEQIIRYQKYAAEKNQRVTIVLGVGGEPSMPEELYLIPVDVLQDVLSKPSLIHKYKRQYMNKWFTLEEFFT